jgi:hypothetical protein
VRKHPFQRPPWYQSPKGPFWPLQSRGSRSFEACNHCSTWNFSLRKRTLAATLSKWERLRWQRTNKSTRWGEIYLILVKPWSSK